MDGIAWPTQPVVLRAVFQHEFGFFFIDMFLSLAKCTHTPSITTAYTHTSIRRSKLMFGTVSTVQC